MLLFFLVYVLFIGDRDEEGVGCIDHSSISISFIQSSCTARIVKLDVGYQSRITI